MLDLTTPLTYQDENKWKAYVRKALERDPSLKQYDGAWPVGIYTAKFLGKAAYTNRRMGSKRGGTESRDVDEANGTTQSASGLSAVVSSSVAPGDDNVSSCTRTALPMASSDPPTRSLHHLLRSFDPPLDSLMADLQIGGVTTAREFLSLKQWPEADRGLFLRVDLKLNPFNTRQIELALANLKFE
ncbi:hypothetical protein EW026_g2802 [Hermanssonia centrifuga]|uniref:Uncharacterized protein n=1 Tax=Hermanssonia centrifuga TaxID=98765 RepID=A0A4S4KM25_9APHY|nr:hypothetical protein EW026_g2802 [Hermanssonia centrifuga]